MSKAKTIDFKCLLIFPLFHFCPSGAVCSREKNKGQYLATSFNSEGNPFLLGQGKTHMFFLCLVYTPQVPCVLKGPSLRDIW